MTSDPSFLTCGYEGAIKTVQTGLETALKLQTALMRQWGEALTQGPAQLLALDFASVAERTQHNQTEIARILQEGFAEQLRAFQPSAGA
jgi:DNA-directed RNA polymerase specialized sigma54-like protein